MISYRLGSATVNTQKVMNALSAVLRPAVLEAGAVFEDKAKSNVPVLSGDLRDSIHTDLAEAGPSFVQAVTAPAFEAANKYGFEPAYARRIELGFFGPDSLGRVYHQAAQPYMAPAWYEGQDEAAKVVEDTFRQAVSGV